MQEIMGTILGGTIMMVVLMYFITILFMVIKAARGHLKSDSKGIKMLKFQDGNHTWNKFVIRNKF